MAAIVVTNIMGNPILCGAQGENGHHTHGWSETYLKKLANDIL
jgi:hypothetical protein